MSNENWGDHGHINTYKSELEESGCKYKSVDLKKLSQRMTHAYGSFDDLRIQTLLSLQIKTYKI
jgi:hypothetical protein